VYSGYIDDPRNTDNAWIEIVVYNFHDETGEYVGLLHLHAGNILSCIVVPASSNDDDDDDDVGVTMEMWVLLN